MRTRRALLLSLPLVLLAFVLRAPTSHGQVPFDYGDALTKAVGFFDANKCGANVAADNVFGWRSACHTTDGSQASPALDLSGGFHDAGDHVKFGLPQGFSAGVLGWSLYEYRAEFDAEGLTPKTLRTLRYFTDYFLKSHPDATTFYYQVGDGNVDHGYWGSPELQTGSRPVLVARPGAPASDILGQTSAALALMSINYRSTDAAYANRCLAAARELFDMGRTSLGRGSDGGGGAFYRSTSHFDDLAWAAIWLYVATNDQTYLAPVDGWISQPNDTNDNPYQKRWTMAWDDMTLANLLKMFQLTGQTKYYDGLVWNLTWYRDTLQKTPSGLPWLNQWGVLRYASAEAGLGFLADKLFGFTGFANTGNFIVDYTLGTNPRHGSFVTNYLTSPPVHPHHRANEPVQGGPTHGLLGALVGGPGSADDYADTVGDFQRNEVALDYNASYVFALAGRLFFANGGQPGTPPTPPPPPPMSPPGTGTGLPGTYFQGTALAGAPLLSRLDATVNFNWGGGSPDPAVPADQFSVRWEGLVEARSDELYTFYVSHDDGARLWVNDQLVVNNWTDHAAVEDSGAIALRLGQRYAIRLEFYENGGDASVSLSWSTPAGIAKQIIPATQLAASGPPTPNFALTPSPTSLSLAQGATATSTITVTRAGGFTGTVDLSAGGLPSGVTASFSPASVTGASSTLTLTASGTATTGPATVTVTGTGGGLTRTASISLSVVAPPPPANFTLSASPASVTVTQGASAATTVAIARTNFTGAVGLSASGLPPGVTASFNPASTSGGSSTLTFAASAAATAGPASVTVTGTGGGLTRTTSIALTVTAPPPSDFMLAAAPASVSLTQGATAATTVNITRTNFTGAVALSASGLPGGVTASFNPASATGNSSTLTFTASATATAGPASVTVTGTGGGLTRTASVSLTVSAGGGGTGGVTVAPVVTTSSPWFNEEQLRISNTANITSLSITLVVQRTTGISVNGQYNTVGSQITQSNSSTSAAITYLFALAAGQTLGPATGRTFAAQTSGTGTVHPTAGDTFTVTYTTGGATFTQTGHF
jgi:hypothetical protein